jgi:hypothetical protein
MLWNELRTAKLVRKLNTFRRRLRIGNGSQADIIEIIWWRRIIQLTTTPLYAVAIYWEIM